MVFCKQKYKKVSIDSVFLKNKSSINACNNRIIEDLLYPRPIHNREKMG